MEDKDFLNYLKEISSISVSWEELKHNLMPTTEIIDGKEVYCFFQTIDMKNKLIEENIVITLQPFYTFIPLHMHNFVELTYAYKGSCTLEIYGKEVTLTEGSIIMINKFTPHLVRETTKDDIIVNLTLKNDYFSPAFLSRLSSTSIITDFLVNSIIKERNNNKYLIFEQPSKNAMTHVMEQVMKEYFNKRIFHREIINSYIVIIFTELMRQSEHEKRVPYNTKSDASLIIFLQYIETHYQHCNLVEMGKHFNFHPNYISALLKQSTGKSFKELLQLQKLNKACMYLASSDMPIPDIVSEVGYSGIAFFYKKFKEIFNQTPSEYRKEKQRLSD